MRRLEWVVKLSSVAVELGKRRGVPPTATFVYQKAGSIGGLEDLGAGDVRMSRTLHALAMLPRELFDDVLRYV